MPSTEKKAKPNLKTNKDNKNKKKYQKPRIVHTKVIETLAGSCSQAGGCGVMYT